METVRHRQSKEILDQLKEERYSVIRLLTITIVIIFAIESIVMLFLGYILPPLPKLVHSLIDGVILVAVLFPLLYFLVFMPMLSEITRRKQAEAMLRKEHDELEMRVQEHTSEVTKANEILQAKIAECKQAEQQLEISLKEKELLLREIHHRVKNNMQVISSLLNLQIEHIKEEKYHAMFKESQNRILSMSLIHEKLYQSGDLTKIDFSEYIKDLVNDLFQYYGANAGNIALNINVKNVSLEVDSAIPCGLIINELVTNSLKYAFPDGTKGEIKISLRPINENMIELAVSDNGIGIPAELDFENTHSLGLYLVKILAENQLQGELHLDRSKGTEFKIKFKGK